MVISLPFSSLRGLAMAVAFRLGGEDEKCRLHFTDGDRASFCRAAAVGSMRVDRNGGKRKSRRSGRGVAVHVRLLRG
jgi:hypothetical protein